MITPDDDHMHDFTKYPGDWNRTTHWWNESGWFNFHIPERSTSGFFYVHHRPANGLVWAGTALWDPNGDQAENCLFYDWNLYPAVSDGADAFTFELPNSLRFECLEPMKKFRFTYDNDGLQAEILWEAFTDPQDQADRGFPPEWTGWFEGHYEQFGRATGEVRIGGRTLEVDEFTARDRSFGPLRMTNMGRGTFAWGVASEDHGFFPYAVAREPVESDPIFGTVDEVKGGWYIRDGVVSTLVSGERTVVDRDDSGRPLAELIVAKDALGRELRAEGVVKNHLFFQGHPEYWWWLCMTEWNLNGEQAWGETQDAAIAPHWRRVLYERHAPSSGAAAT